ncbi:MAG: homoserine O-acetyltransferase [Crocinitomicaceae bacterium]|nr:homoserine O-acetyltransferase [Crocinitomicaceae bacterium]
MKTEKLTLIRPFKLESGVTLSELDIAYTIQGNPATQPVLWVCHALTGNQFVNEWWAGIFGEGKVFSEKDYCIICANVLGSSYGSTGPTNAPNNITFNDFPEITTKDMVKAHKILANALRIDKIDILIGASIGGQQAIEWAAQKSIEIARLILIATNAIHSPYGRAFNEAQRLAIQGDLTFGLNSETAGKEGLKAARGIAMLSYRSYEDFQRKQGETGHEKRKDFRAASYIKYQGEKLSERFNAYSYYRLTQAMDSHDIARGTGESLEAILLGIKAKTLVIGIDSDLLFPPREQKLIANWIPNAEYVELNSPYGHDAFLIEFDWLRNTLQKFIRETRKITITTTFKRQLS